MTKTEFIESMQNFIDELKEGSWGCFDPSKGVTLFGNKNYGEIWIDVSESCTIHAKLYTATEEEKKG